LRIFQSDWQDGKGVGFHLQAWEPDARPKAVVALVHGLGEHIVRYSAMGEALAKDGFAAVGFDLRGHGRSNGPRGHTPSYEALMDDVGALLGHAALRHPRRPIFLYGHSLGGALVLNYVLRRSTKLQGVIASAPWLKTMLKISPLKLALVRVLDPIIPMYSEPWGLEPAALSRDSTVGGAFTRDPLTHSRISVRMYLECMRAGLWAMEHAAELPLPLLLMHGTADRITSWEASREFARRAGARVTLRLWDGWYHELHSEPGSARVLRTMVSWMNRNLGNPRIPRSSAGQNGRGMGKSRPPLRHGA
jgi:alpha-beta hydrolase superfamily lysophospholipase